MATRDPRQIVTEGYDANAAAFASWMAADVVDAPRARYEAAFSALLSDGARVLDLGCGGGGGGPTTEAFARRFALTGIDISARQIERARERLPMATFVQADMTRFESTPGTFDGVGAFYTLIHLPYGELPAMLGRIASWLRSGGVFVASLSGRDEHSEHVEEAWVGGAPMYWSGYPPADSLRFVRDAGLVIVDSSIEAVVEEGQSLPVLWVLARKP